MITKKEACRIAASESGHSYIEEIRETETGYILPTEWTSFVKAKR